MKKQPLGLRCSSRLGTVQRKLPLTGTNSRINMYFRLLLAHAIIWNGGDDMRMGSSTARKQRLVVLRKSPKKCSMQFVVTGTLVPWMHRKAHTKSRLCAAVAIASSGSCRCFMHRAQALTSSARSGRICGAAWEPCSLLDLDHNVMQLPGFS